MAKSRKKSGDVPLCWAFEPGPAPRPQITDPDAVAKLIADGFEADRYYVVLTVDDGRRPPLAAKIIREFSLCVYRAEGDRYAAGLFRFLDTTGLSYWFRVMALPRDRFCSHCWDAWLAEAVDVTSPADPDNPDPAGAPFLAIVRPDQYGPAKRFTAALFAKSLHFFHPDPGSN